MIVKREGAIKFSIKNSPTLEALSESIKEDLIHSSQIISLEAKKDDYNEFGIETNKTYILAEGRAFLSCIGRDGRKIILEELEEGDFFGDLNLLSEEDLNTECLFIEPFPKSIVKIYEFKKEDFLKLLIKNIDLFLVVISLMARRVSRLENKIEESAFLSLKTRLLAELIRLGQPEGNEGLIRVKYKITHEKLAQTIGAVRETVSKALIELHKEGFIDYDQKKRIIINLSKRKRGYKVTQANSL